MTPHDFATLVAPHRTGLVANCYRMLGSPADAEDVVQGTLVRAWRAFESFGLPLALEA
jgi:RNA polymerase sigma-70 factor (ECF subfamily)